MVKKSIEIDDWQQQWLEDNDWFNLSGFTRQELTEKIEAFEGTDLESVKDRYSA